MSQRKHISFVPSAKTATAPRVDHAALRYITYLLALLLLLSGLLLLPVWAF